MKKSSILLMTMLGLSIISFGQNGQYDVRLNLNGYDCNAQELLVDIDVRASSPDSTFRIAEQNYRFSFNTNAVDSVSIIEEGVISSFSAPSGGSLGFSLYTPHNLEGTLDNEISYNIELVGGDGVLIETEWVHVGTLAFSISDIDAPLDLNWYTQADFSPTFISEKYEDTLFEVVEGMYINDVGANTFGEICTCPLNDIVLTTQQEVDDFATNYPECTELVGSLIIDSNVNMDIADLTPLNVITSIGGELTITNNNALNSLAGLENITSIGGELSITNNSQLSNCDIQNICDHLENGGQAVVNNNASGCNSITEVNMACLPDCPVGNITFGSDWEVNNFLNNYPNCTELAGNVTVQSDSFDEYGGFWNLSFLSQITSIAGDLNIYNNNYYAFVLAGLENLTFVGGDLNIGGNSNLYGLGGLENLNTVNGRLNINGNQSLTSLDDLIGLTTIGDLKITSNKALIVCNVPIICNYLANNGSYEISNNSVGCSSVEVVSELCSSTPPLCPPGGVGVTSEAELYGIFSLYPNCTEIAGDLYVNIDNIYDFANFNALNQITAIEGNVTLIGIGVYQLTGLSNLTSIGGDLKIDHTDMQSLEGLENLTSIDGSLIITNNYGLEDITGIGNIDYTTINDMEIHGNNNLTVCNVSNICDYLGNSGTATINNNSNYSAGCNNYSEVTQSCFLPVEISTPLQARLQNQTAFLTWRTETETHNAGFEIQRSKDGIQWERIGWQAGQGDTTVPHAYTYTDESPLSGASYYQLKQVDFDGNFTYSNIVDLHYERNTPISVYPNPVRNMLYINTELPIQQALVFDVTGKIINAQITDNKIDVSTLPAGIYTLKITIGDGIFYEKILVK